VLVDFPIAGQKSIGFLTRTMTDETTGQTLAAVLLPNASTLHRLFCRFCLWRGDRDRLTMEQAMSMLMTGGAVGPETIRFESPVAIPPILTG